MTPGSPDRVTVVDRLLACWEVSRLAALPTGFTLLSVGPMAVGLYALVEVGGRAGPSIGLAMVAAWLVVVLLEHGRAVWGLRHPYASLSWLRSLRAAIGNRVVDEVLARLARQYASTLDDAVRRYDVAVAVWALSDARRAASGGRSPKSRYARS